MRSKVKIINHASKPKYNFLVIGFVILLLGGVIGGYIGFAAGQVPPPVSHPPGEIFGDGNIIGNILVEGNFGVWSSSLPWTFTITHSTGTMAGNFPTIDFSNSLLTVEEVTTDVVNYPFDPNFPNNNQEYSYPKTYSRYISHTQVGVNIPIPLAITDDLCGDIDGCRIVMRMTDGNFVGDEKSISQHMTMHTSSGHWNSENFWSGQDGNGGLGQAIPSFDCWFHDGETAGSIDSGPGFAFINQLDGFDDSRTKCRIIIYDH
jgi:hypothetical protein